MINKLGIHNNTNDEHTCFDNKLKKNTSDNIHYHVEVNVTRCLTDNHQDCSGKYSDSYGNLLVNCLCICHNRFTITPKGIIKK